MFGEYLRTTPPQIPKIYKIAENRLKFGFSLVAGKGWGGQESVDSDHAIVYRFGLWVNSDQFGYDLLAATPNYPYEWKSLENCVSRLISESVTSTVGRENGKR